MKTLYIECNMGAAGDMLMAALLELTQSPDVFLKTMNTIGLPGVTVTREPAVKCGITGTHMRVSINGEEEQSCDVKTHSQPEPPLAHTHEHAHPHSHEPAHTHSHTPAQTPHTHMGIAGIQALIARLLVPESVKQDALAVYTLIAKAEAHVHGKPLSEVHFHEVGSLDAVADIVGVCLLMAELAPEKVVVSPIHVGSGQVRCAHGVLPVPAPATAHILRGAPTYSGSVQGELCTPTGAALLQHFATQFGSQPIMCTESIGYGMGKKDFPAANCVRVFYDETQEDTRDEVCEISCNVDDMTGEDIGFAQEILLQNSALDVWIVPIQMKKNRPGQMLCCLCHPQETDALAALMLRHTTSFGVRITTARRHRLARTFSPATTPWGKVRIKTGTAPNITKSKPEYEDIAALARANSLTLDEVRRAIQKDGDS